MPRETPSPVPPATDPSRTSLRSPGRHHRVGSRRPCRGPALRYAATSFARRCGDGVGRGRTGSPATGGTRGSFRSPGPRPSASPTGMRSKKHVPLPLVGDDDPAAFPDGYRTATSVRSTGAGGRRRRGGCAWNIRRVTSCSWTLRAPCRTPASGHGRGDAGVSLRGRERRLQLPVGGSGAGSIALQLDHGHEALRPKYDVSKRSRRKRGLLALVAREARHRMLLYGKAHLTREIQNEAILAFIECWETRAGQPPRELVFDSRFTTYANLVQLTAREI